LSNADAFCQFFTPRGPTENNERGKKDPAEKFDNNSIPVELKVYGRKSMTLDGRILPFPVRGYKYCQNGQYLPLMSTYVHIKSTSVPLNLAKTWENWHIMEFGMVLA
jgi:hypothetical protein